MLTDTEYQRFKEQGFLPLRRVMSDEQLMGIRQRLDDLTQGRIENNAVSFQLEPAYRESLGNIKVAPDGFAGPSDHYRKLGKLDHDPLFLAYLCHPRLCSIMKQLIGSALAIHRAIALMKPAFDGSPLSWHQDVGDGFPDQRGRFFTIWTALDDASADNGALRVLPGSQRLPALAAPWSMLTQRSREVAAQMVGEEIVLEARAGEAYLLDNFLLHSSGPNPTPRPRRAFTAIYTDANTPIQGQSAEYHQQFTRVCGS